MKYRWNVAPPRPVSAELTAAFPTILTTCLVNRGFCDPHTIRMFLQPRLKDLKDPFLLPDMEVAVERLLVARQQEEAVVVFGDYDVDGVTSTTLLLEVLRSLGWKVDAYVPHRMDEGYGLTMEGAANCRSRFPSSLLLAVDCGSTAVECIDAIRKEGRDIIVLDHHQLSDPPPRATAMVNPRKLLPDGQEGGGEFQELCSVGLAFKLAHALLKRGRQMGLEGAADFDLKTVLDLVALGTIADLVPLTGENRILVTAGLERLRATTRLGLVWLKRVAGCADAAIEPHHVGYQLAPRLNAVGRLQTAEQALTLLLTKDEQQARDLAEALDRCNRERQNLERDIAEQALSAVLKRYNPESDYVIVEGNVSWHIGVVGIVASRLLQQFHRPTIVVGGDGERWRGSGRSIDGFDLAEALRHCSDLLVRHGGHAMAAGVTVLPEQIDAFRSRLNEFARRTLKSEQLSPVLRLDGQVGFNELTADSLNHLAKLMPTGQGNPAPQFCARNVSHRAPPVRISQGKHVKMQVTDGHTVLETLWWSPGGAELPSGRFDIAFAPQLSTYNGRTKVQLKLLDWCPAQSF